MLLQLAQQAARFVGFRFKRWLAFGVSHVLSLSPHTAVSSFRTLAIRMPPFHMYSTVWHVANELRIVIVVAYFYYFILTLTIQVDFK